MAGSSKVNDHDLRKASHKTRDSFSTSSIMRGQDFPNTRKLFFFFSICKVKHIQFHLNEVEKHISQEYRRAQFSLSFLNSYAARESNRFQPKGNQVPYCEECAQTQVIRLCCLTLTPGEEPLGFPQCPTFRVPTVLNK